MSMHNHAPHFPRDFVSKLCIHIPRSRYDRSAQVCFYTQMMALFNRIMMQFCDWIIMISIQAHHCRGYTMISTMISTAWNQIAMDLLIMLVMMLVITMTAVITYHIPVTLLSAIKWHNMMHIPPRHITQGAILYSKSWIPYSKSWILNSEWVILH